MRCDGDGGCADAPLSAARVGAFVMLRLWVWVWCWVLCWLLCWLCCW